MGLSRAAETVALSGLLLILVGVAMISVPAAVILAGLALTGAAALLDWDK